jgi:hypothetical protein
MIAAPADQLETAALTISSWLVGRCGLSVVVAMLPVTAAVITTGSLTFERLRNSHIRSSSR